MVSEYLRHWKAAIDSKPIIILGIPNEQRSEEVCLDTMKEDFRTFHYLTKEQKTPAIYRYYIQDSPWNLYSLAEEEVTTELIILAGQYGDPDFVHDMEDRHMTPEVLKAIIGYDGYKIVYIDPKFVNDELILLASMTIQEDDWEHWIPEIYDIRRRMSTKKAN